MENEVVIINRYRNIEKCNRRTFKWFVRFCKNNFKFKETKIVRSYKKIINRGKNEKSKGWKLYWFWTMALWIT